MSNARELVDFPLAYPDRTMWVRVIPASVVDLNFNPPSWLGWMKLLLATVNWSLSVTTFSMSLPIVLSRTIGRKAFGWSYEGLLGLGMMMVDEILKYSGQCPRLMQASVMLTMLVRHESSLMINFKWCQVNLSGPGTNESLHLLIANLNSFLENGDQFWEGLFSISLMTLGSTCRLRAVLNVLWSTFHKLLWVRQGCPLWVMALMAGSFLLFIQFISSQGLWLLFAISWILSSKSDLLVSLTIFLNFFQFSRLLDNL